jgi:hypothetical protein
VVRSIEHTFEEFIENRAISSQIIIVTVQAALSSALSTVLAQAITV